jgi:2-C-methyl-D-erythritol 4-phosphate cytidylyltransferase
VHTAVLLDGAHPALAEHARRALYALGVHRILAPGGLRAALGDLAPDAVVLIHDPGGCPAPAEVLAEVVAVLEEGGADAVVAVAPATDTIKRVGPHGRITGTVDRTGVVEPRTPQAYRAGALAAALDAAEPGAVQAAFAAGDHGLLPDLVAGTVRVISLPRESLRVTCDADAATAARLLGLSRRAAPRRAGGRPARSP